MKKMIMALILMGIVYAPMLMPNEVHAASVNSTKTVTCKLGEYYPVKGTPYKIAVEKYKDGGIRFKAKQLQSTYLYLAVPLTHEYILKRKDRYYGMGGWIEVQNDAYQSNSFIDKMVKTACAIARKAGCEMNSAEVGDDVMAFEFGE